METMETFDLVIVGAGIHGIAMLKTYRDVNPSSNILVLEKAGSLGGVWAKHRLYPNLYTNNHFKTFEFSDYPMSTEGFDPTNDHIPGEHMSAYLQNYATIFDLLKHMRFNCDVESAVDDGDSGWTLTVTNTESGTHNQIKAAKLVIATGLTSEPFMPPPFKDSEDFGVPILHSSEFAKANNGLGPYQRVVVFSGAKSSWDVAYAYASAGVQVDWVIRESGHGPCWMTPNRLTPLQIIPELLLQTRLLTWLSPSIYANSWVRNLVHGHWLGRKLVDAVFAKMEHSILEHNDYDAHPETAKLRPWDYMFFIGTNRGLLNYKPDFFELVRNGMIRVHISDIVELSPNTIHLASGDSLDADVLICGTGWKHTPPIKFESDRELGLPGPSSPSSRELAQRADDEIFGKFPKLREQPEKKPDRRPLSACAEEEEPYRLYRFMVPPAFMPSRTLAFAGAYRSPATCIIAQAQALWITAFFGNDIPALHKIVNAPNEDSAGLKTLAKKEVMYETVLHTQFCKWRYSLGFGARFPDLWFDCLPYVDLLLEDIGVNNRRKGSWLQEIFTGYVPRDYERIVREFLNMRDERDRNGKAKKA